MAVIAIVAVLAVASVVSFATLLTSMRTTHCGELLQGTLSLARRTAVSHSHVVEVRFFKCAVPSDPAASANLWRGFQAVEIQEDGSERPIGSGATVLPYGFIMTDNAEKSPLLQPALSYTGASPVSIPNVTGFRRFRFMPDGSTDLPYFDPARTQWFVTIYNAVDSSKGDPPPNFVALQVEPVTGAINIIRP